MAIGATELDIVSTLEVRRCPKTMGSCLSSVVWLAGIDSWLLDLDPQGMIEVHLPVLSRALCGAFPLKI
jgi:hypothetical protein